MKNSGTDNAVLVNRPLALSSFQLFVAIIVLIFPFMILHFYFMAQKTHWFFYGFILSLGYSAYLIWRMRFDIQNSVESFLKFNPKIEFNSEGIFLFTKNMRKKDSYNWHNVQESSRTLIENENSYEIELVMHNGRIIKIYDNKDWYQFKKIQKWAGGKLEMKSNIVEEIRLQQI